MWDQVPGGTDVAQCGPETKTQLGFGDEVFVKAEENVKLLLEF